MNVFDVPQEVLRVPDPQLLRRLDIPAPQPRTADVEFPFSEQLRAYYQPAMRTMWSRWNPAPRPCFNARLLADIRRYHKFLADSGGRIDCGGTLQPLEYVVLASHRAGAFHLGGDLDLFKNLI